MISTKSIMEALEFVKDPELGLSIVEIGLVYDVRAEHHQVTVKMTLTSPGCGLAGSIVQDVQQTLKDKIPEIQEVKVDVVFDPPWNPMMMTESAKKKVGFDDSMM